MTSAHTNAALGCAAVAPSARRGPAVGGGESPVAGRLCAIAMVLLLPVLDASAAWAAPGARPAVPPAPAATGANEASDWRGLHRLDARGNRVQARRATVNDFERLVANAPYRVQVATSDGRAIRIVDGYTLERSRLFDGAAVHGFGFNGDGTLLYAVVGEGPKLRVIAIDVQSAKSREVGALVLGDDETVAHVEGGAGGKELGATVTVGLSTKADGCQRFEQLRRLRVRAGVGGAPGRDAAEALAGPPTLAGPLRKAAIAPNTKWRAELKDGLQLQGRFGNATQARIDREPVPRTAVGLAWMRDSRGILVAGRRPGCDPAEVVAYRAAADGNGWSAQRVPADVELGVPGIDPLALRLAPDGMRLVGTQAGRVVLVEPAPRFRGLIAVISEEGAVPPQIRPGVRTLATGAGGLRFAELLLEQGDLEAAAAQLEQDGPGAPAAELQRLSARLAKLRSVRDKRAQELGLPGCALSSVGCGAMPSPPPAAPEAAPAPASRPPAPAPDAILPPPPGRG